MRLSVVLVNAAILSLVRSFTRSIKDIPLNEWPMLRSHNAGTGYYTRQHPLWRSLKNQEGNLTRQLECGVRAFDLRPACTDDGIVMHHSDFPVNHSLEKALGEVISWANAHPFELVVVANSHYSPNNDDCKSKVWNLMAELGLMKSIGSDGSCDRLKGLTVGQAMDMSKTEGGGSVFVVEGEGRCSDPNWDPSIQCYSNDGHNCYDGSKQSEVLNKKLYDYIQTTASRKPQPDRLFTIQAHWQYDFTAITRMLGAGSDLLTDTKVSGVNNHSIGLISKLKYVNFFQTNDACLDGGRLFWALRFKGILPPPS